MNLAAKWDAIYQQKTHYTAQAALVLTENVFLLPETGQALDFACGLGANALFLADYGLEVEAVDISAVAVEKLQQQARTKNLSITAKQHDVQLIPLPENAFDVIVISRFLDRSLSHGIIAALKADGLLFYQTYTQQKITDSPPHNPAFLLAENELLHLFSPLKTVFYQEHSLVGNMDYGERDEALYIGQKR